VTTTDATDATNAEVHPLNLLVELFTTPAGKADPYPRYAGLHERAPVLATPMGVVCSGFDDCQFVLRDHRFGKDEEGFRARFGATESQLAILETFEEGEPSMLMLNPPDHTRLRGLVSKAFTPRTVEALRPHIVRLTDELLDDVGSGEVEVMSALAFPLPVTVIGELLGVPVEDRPQFQHLIRAATKTLELVFSDEELAAGVEAFTTVRDYFVDLVAERRRAPRDDLLSELIAARDEGDRLSEGEIVSTAILLFAAGFETTTNLIGNGLYALLRHPDQLRRLRDDRTLLRPGVEELLRYDSPVQIDGRAAFDDLDLHGHRLSAGTLVVTLLGAANHDPTHFTDPGRLDVGRDEGPPLSFGGGIHYCLGAALARVEGQVVFDRLFDRFAELELAGPAPRYRDSLTLRGLLELPVAVRSG
jgi:cytochrome P450